MRIARRPSGGRGEYEISDEFNGLTPRDLFERAITLVLSSDWEFSTDIVLRDQGGKPRLRRLQNRAIQLPRQLAAALMMPAPVRERPAFGDGLPILREQAYGIETIPLSNVQFVGGNAVRLTVADILVENGNHHAEPINFPSRVQEVQTIWEGEDALPPELGELVARHRDLVGVGGPIPEETEDVISELQRVMTENAEDYGTIIRQGREDVVPDLLKMLGGTPPQPTVRVEEVAPNEIEIKRRVKKEWRRWANARGPESRRFKEQVRTAYRSTCIFCGLRFPKTPLISTPGIDAAHILPWTDYDLDLCSNGVCCCKLHHWAFDESLLVLRWDAEAMQYVVEVPAKLAQQFRADYPEFDIEALVRLAGPVPTSRLPSRSQDRPSSQCLERLNESE